MDLTFDEFFDKMLYYIKQADKHPADEAKWLNMACELADKHPIFDSVWEGLSLSECKARMGAE